MTEITVKTKDLMGLIELTKTALASTNEKISHLIDIVNAKKGGYFFVLKGKTENGDKTWIETILRPLSVLEEEKYIQSNKVEFTDELREELIGLINKDLENNND